MTVTGPESRWSVVKIRLEQTDKDYLVKAWQQQKVISTVASRRMRSYPMISNYQGGMIYSRINSVTMKTSVQDFWILLFRSWGETAEKNDDSDHCLKCGERKGNVVMMSKDTAWFFICWQSSYGWSFHWAGITQKKILKKKWYSSRNVLNYIKPQHMSVFVLFCFLASSHPLFVISLLL